MRTVGYAAGVAAFELSATCIQFFLEKEFRMKQKNGDKEAGIEWNTGVAVSAFNVEYCIIKTFNVAVMFAPHLD